MRNKTLALTLGIAFLAVVVLGCLAFWSFQPGGEGTSLSISAAQVKLQGIEEETADLAKQIENLFPDDSQPNPKPDPSPRFEKSETKKIDNPKTKKTVVPKKADGLAILRGKVTKLKEDASEAERLASIAFDDIARRLSVIKNPAVRAEAENKVASSRKRFNSALTQSRRDLSDLARTLNTAEEYARAATILKDLGGINEQVARLRKTRQQAKAIAVELGHRIADARLELQAVK